MTAFFYYPFYLFLFWYKNVVGGTFSFFVSFNRYVSSLLSLPLLLRTFFKPLKNEYRPGLVLFSILFGIVIKSFLIFISGIFMLILLFVEVVVELILIATPILILLVIFAGRGIR